MFFKILDRFVVLCIELEMRPDLKPQRVQINGLPSSVSPSAIL